MPSALHEGLIEMFRQRPAFAAELVAELFKVDVPPWQHARLDSSDLPVLAPTEYRAEVVVTLLAGQQPVLAVIVENQLKSDPTKRRTWPVYLTTLHADRVTSCTDFDQLEVWIKQAATANTLDEVFG